MRSHPVEAVGNAFLLVDARETGHHDWAEAARTLCWGADKLRADCDGLLVVESVDPLRLRMFNPDGTEDFCGNGLLCTAAYAWESGAVRTESFVIEHGGKLIQAHVEVAGGSVCRSTVSLAAPTFVARSIPVLSPHATEEPFAVELDDVPHALWPVSTGTAHAVVFLDEPLAEREFQEWSPRIENHPSFPERTTVDWVTPQGPGRVAVRIWERGVGETLGCGTGAAAVTATSFGRLHEGSLDVQSKGGLLHVEWPGEGPIELSGTASVTARRGVFGAE
jgi:diaminopimelate epimerase